MSIKTINLAVDLAGAVLCLMAILHLLIALRGSIRQKRFFLYFYTCLLFYVLSHMGGLLMKGLPGANWHLGLRIANFCEFLCGGILPFILSSYLVGRLTDGKERTWLTRILLFGQLLTLSVLIISQFNGMIYTIDEQNYYQREPLYPLFYIGSFLAVSVDFCLIIRHRKQAGRRVVVAVLIYLIVPLIFSVVQLFFYGPAFTIYTTLFSAFIMYVILLTEQMEQYYRQENEKTVLRLNLLSSQIRPHYIYNVLTSIHVLCRKDPEKAMRVVEHFTEYLRANFEGIAAENLVCFQDELRHIEAYLEVERCRFMDELIVEYHIDHTAFRLPALTVQPIVENAVKHGSGNEDVPLRITISTRRTESGSEIVVEDDGQGCEELQLSESMKALKNVKERLRLMCGGTLEISSQKGTGTRVLIRIPDGNRTGAIQ